MIVDFISIDINPMEGSLVRHLWAPSTQGWANGFGTFLGNEAGTNSNMTPQEQDA